MWQVSWNPLKSERLKRTRVVSFEEIIIYGKMLGFDKHPSSENQGILVYEYKGYAWALPFVLNEDIIFFKTLYPSRKYRKIYMRR